MSEAAQFRKLNSDTEHIKRSWPSTGVKRLVQMPNIRSVLVLGLFRLAVSENRIRGQRRFSSATLIPIPIPRNEVGPVQELCIWNKQFRQKADQFRVCSGHMYLNIVSASEAAQFHKFHSDSDHVDRGCPSAGVIHLAQITMARDGSTLDSFRPNASENPVGGRGGPVPQILFRF